MFGRKSRPPGHCSGGSPRSPLLHLRQHVSTPLPRGYRLGVLHHAVAVFSPPSGPSLSGADGRRIPCWGERPFTVTIGGVPRQWQFLLAAVSFPILGVDFLRHHTLVVDVANLRLSSPTPVVGPGAADQGSTEVKAPSGSSVPPATAAAFLCGRYRHPWAVLRGRRPCFPRGFSAGPGRRSHLPWRPLYTFTLCSFTPRLRHPLWFAGGTG